MLDLNMIRQRAATRANVATPANVANWLVPPMPEPKPIGQLAALASDSLVGAVACGTCRNYSRVKTCKRPVDAGLAPHFMIVWPPKSHAARCRAWKRVPYEAQTLVLIESARRGWTEAERDAWLADADADPGAVLEVLNRRV